MQPRVQLAVPLSRVLALAVRGKRPDRVVLGRRQQLRVAVQAAAGRSNRQIAADHHISVRTVENHLQHVYEKLGITSRRELADALRDQPGT